MKACECQVTHTALLHCPLARHCSYQHTLHTCAVRRHSPDFTRVFRSYKKPRFLRIKAEIPYKPCCVINDSLRMRTDYFSYENIIRVSRPSLLKQQPLQRCSRFKSWFSPVRQAQYRNTFPTSHHFHSPTQYYLVISCGVIHILCRWYSIVRRSTTKAHCGTRDREMYCNCYIAVLVYFNLLKTKPNLLYIRNQSVPRSKHFPPRI